MNTYTPEYCARLLREEAHRLGFDFVGISPAGFLEEEAPRLEAWLNKGYQGRMSYMENHFDKRLDPRLLVEGAKSVVSLTFNYYTDARSADPESPKIAKYAYGKDYHTVLKEKLRALMSFLQTEIGEINGRVFTDSAPIMERQWAAKSGVGWIGKNSLLLNRKQGSYFFLAELILDIELATDTPIKDYCGSCKRCIDACPTQAIVGNGLLDASRCISYFTIELRGDLPQEMQPYFDNWMFGCDICQEVCPWNRFARPHQEPDLLPHPKLLKMTKKEWTELTQEVFNDIFRGSAVKRTRYEGLMRNIEFLNREDR